ncbi:MAG TPA: HD domain-containing protein [Candidatus Limnocylindrales bacterium]
MTVPSRTAAAALLYSLDPPAWHVRHARAVAEVAGFLALRIAARGIPLDRRAVEAAALLHDVDKILPADDPARVLPHGEGSAAWLVRHGHPELARIVAAHPVSRLRDGETQRRWAAFASREERVVAYADKRARQRVVSMDERFATWERSHPGTWDAATRRTVRARAARLETEVCHAAGITPEDVRRLRWTGPALRAARLAAAAA